MESSPTDIISFLGKQLRYQVLPFHVLLEVCLTAYSTEEIIDARNIVLEAFCETTDYTHQRDLQTQSSRKDLISIIHCLKDFPCAVGEERHYTNNIKLRSAYARLEGLSQIVENWNFPFSNPDEMMPAQSSSLSDTENAHHNAQNNIVEQAPMPTNQEIESPPVNPEVQPDVVPVKPENQTEFPMQADGPEAGPLPDLGLQALSFNPIPNEQEVTPALLEPIVDVVVKETVEQPKVAAFNEPAAQEENPDDNPEDEIASLSNDTTSSSSTSTSSDTSDEDNLPLIPFYQPGPRNGPMIPMIPERSLPRREGLPPPSRPISIPVPTRPLPAEEWLSDDDSSPSEGAPSRSKRRRPQ